MHPSQTRETPFNKDEGKHGQRETLESRDMRQVPTKRRVEVQSQKSRFADKRRVYMSCTEGVTPRVARTALHLFLLVRSCRYSPERFGSILLNPLTRVVRVSVRSCASPCEQLQTG